MPIITTYQCSQDVRTIQKTVTNAVEYNCEILDTMNSFTPRIRLFCTSETFNANMVYIPFFDRFYHIISADVESAETIILQCEFDIFTYSTALLSSEFLVTRNENIGSTYIPDTMLPLKGNKEMKVIEFTGGDFNLDSATENSYNFVLNVAGGGSNQGTAENGGLNI